MRVYNLSSQFICGIMNEKLKILYHVYLFQYTWLIDKILQGPTYDYTNLKRSLFTPVFEVQQHHTCTGILISNESFIHTLQQKYHIRCWKT